MQPYQNNPDVPAESVAGDNMFMTPQGVTINGKPAKYFDINGYHGAGPVTIAGTIPVTFEQRTMDGKQLVQGQLIGNAPVVIALDNPKFPAKSTPGITMTWPGVAPQLTGQPDALKLVTDDTGHVGFEVTLNGPLGGTAVLCITSGSNTYEYTVYLGNAPA